MKALPKHLSILRSEWCTHWTIVWPSKVLKARGVCVCVCVEGGRGKGGHTLLLTVWREAHERTLL